MKKSELKSIIKEEISKILNESEVEFDTVEELMRAINNLPDSIGRLDVQDSLDLFSPSMTRVSTNSPDWRITVKGILNSTLSTDLDNETNTFKLKHYGDPEQEHYVQLASDKSKKFDADMGSGRHGKLD